MTITRVIAAVLTLVPQGPAGAPGTPGKDYATIGEATADTIPPTRNALRIYDIGDFKAVASEPVNPLKLQDLGGRWWEARPMSVKPQNFGAAGDGLANDSAALTQAAAFCNLFGATLVLEGDYRVNGPVPGWRTVKKAGSGRVLLGANAIPAETTPTDVVNLYVDPVNGSDDNLGLSTSASALASVPAALAMIPRQASGTWNINFPPGTFPGVSTWLVKSAGTFGPNAPLAVNSTGLTVNLNGAPLSGGLPTTIFDGAGAVPNGLVCAGPFLCNVTNIEFRNYTSAGLSALDYSKVMATGCRWFNCGSIGGQSVECYHAILGLISCKVDGNSKAIATGIVGYNGYLTVSGAGTLITGFASYGAMYASNSNGHFDDATVSDCFVGLRVVSGGITHSRRCTFSGNKYGVFEEKGRWDNVGVGADVNTFSGNTIANISSDTLFGDPLWFGTLAVFGDGTGKLRAKVGAFPSSSTDGDVIGPGLASYTVATVPAASGKVGYMVYVSNESGGATPAFSDGVNWRRVADRTVIS